MLKRVIQVAFLFVGGALGLIFLPILYDVIGIAHYEWINNVYVSLLVGALIFLVLSFFLVDYCIQCIRWLEEVLFKVPVADLLFGTVGLIIGLIVAYFAGFAIERVQLPVITSVVPFVLSIILGYLGFQLGFRRRDEISLMYTPVKPSRKKEVTTQKLLDTSVIIDGRIVDIAATGFIEGTLVIPQFVLTELQHIADSSDTLKRTRGRRGLDVLRRLQDEHKSGVIITDRDFDDVAEVDLKLVRLAKEMNGQIVTNDFNLNKVSELHQVHVLNINDLANAVKPVVIPGEKMTVLIIKDGKEHNQGLAYLDDGTMIVVEGGRNQIGQTVQVEVTSVLQTSAGRMIFAKL
ncbi:MAG: PIN/TRAM domain-containing protein [Caryophanon sp.]|nr:PIN/TRAM domain-containing protein [Caryophanon sp.]